MAKGFSPDVAEYEYEVDENGNEIKVLLNPCGAVYGYCRVSTNQQNLDRQFAAMADYGVPEYKIFADKESGSNFNRPAYKKMLRVLRKGDIIVILDLDRLGRNYQEILDQWRMITQDLGCGIHVISMPLLNTSGDPSDLLNKFISDMMLQVLSFVADNERKSLLERQRQGIDAALRKRKVMIGRPKKPIPWDFWEIYVMWKTQKYSALDLWKYCHECFGMSQRTFYRRINELDQRFGDIPAERLHDLIFDKELFNGIPFDNERIELGIGYYNMFTPNPFKIREKQIRKKERLEENPDLAYEDEERQQRELLEKRQREFRAQFNMPAPTIFDRTDMPRTLIRRDPTQKASAVIQSEIPNNKYAKRVGRAKSGLDTRVVTGGAKYASAHMSNSGIEQAVVLIDDKPIIPPNAKKRVISSDNETATKTISVL